ncbi:hypothetical protein D3C81_2228910 [compost metagenome]
MSQDADLLFLQLLKRVVLVRVVITVEAAQPQAARQTENLFDTELPVMADSVHFSVNHIS